MTDDVRVRRVREIARVDASDPFADDLLDRKPSIETLSEFISHIESPYVLALDAPWGSGKTTFVRMWEAHLKGLGHTALYHNAWESDYADDPLASLISDLTEGIADSRDQGLGTEIKRKANAVLRWIAPHAVRIITHGILDLDDDNVESALAEASSDASLEAVGRFERAREATDDFRRCLSKLSNQAERHPVVIFVDELDRCRPSYAVELLERVKHLFSVPGIIFVLSIARTPLISSITQLYGENYETRRYLHRFIDATYTMPQPSTARYSSSLIESLGIDAQLKRLSNDGQCRDLPDFAAWLATASGQSLRQQERGFTTLLFALLVIPTGQRVYPHFLTVLALLREAYPDEMGELEATGDLEIARAIPDGLNAIAQHPHRDDHLLVVEAVLAIVSDRITKSSKGRARYQNMSTGPAAQARDERLLRLYDMLNDPDLRPYRTTVERLSLSGSFEA